ncbi:hypothetical protein VM1G_11844 [Cytospora mali]|uniref:Uncharacterized protein n=1 Tax=Cytospora mali TaxID=578113 RepID=A0A194WAB6_CYTMA|nr:hypothetical protein VM1G_11844 [Valsa mali]
MLLYRRVQRTPATGDPHHSAHVLGRAGVQQPQAEHRLGLVRQGQHQCRVLLLQRRGLRGQQGVVCRERDDSRVDILRPAPSFQKAKSLMKLTRRTFTSSSSSPVPVGVAPSRCVGSGVLPAAAAGLSRLYRDRRTSQFVLAPRMPVRTICEVSGGSER